MIKQAFILFSFFCTNIDSLLVVSPCSAQEKSQPVELLALKASVGVWDAEIEVWPNGLEADSVKFKGVDKIRAFGEYWLASDFDSEFGGQTVSVHSIVGYDADKKMLVGMVIDQGKYAAQMTGSYDKATKTETWTTRAKAPNGTPMLQKTTITHKSDTERFLVLSVPDGVKKDSFRKFMEIKYVKRVKAAKE